MRVRNFRIKESLLWVIEFDLSSWSHQSDVKKSSSKSKIWIALNLRAFVSWKSNIFINKVIICVNIITSILQSIRCQESVHTMYKQSGVSLGIVKSFSSRFPWSGSKSTDSRKLTNEIKFKKLLYVYQSFFKLQLLRNIFILLMEHFETLFQNSRTPCRISIFKRVPDILYIGGFWDKTFNKPF